MPPFEAPDKDKFGSVRRAIEDGIKWNQDHLDQVAMQKAMDILAGKSGGWSQPSGRSSPPATSSER